MDQTKRRPSHQARLGFETILGLLLAVQGCGGDGTDPTVDGTEIGGGAATGGRTSTSGALGGTNTAGAASTAGGVSSGGSKGTPTAGTSAEAGAGTMGGSPASGGSSAATAGAGGASGGAASGGNSGAAGGANAIGGSTSAGGSSASEFSCGDSGAAVFPAPTGTLIDFDISGRSESEVHESGYNVWVPAAAASDSKTFGGVTFKLAVSGSGTLDSVWYKTIVQSPSYARLVGDGVSVTGATTGAIQLTLTGLSAGTHTLLAYHNGVDATALAPMSVTVDGTKQIASLQPTNRAISTNASAYSFVTFTATAGKSVNIVYAPVSGSGTQNVVINGLALDVPNTALQAKLVSPGDRDWHVDADSGSVNLSWTAAKSATSHHLYLGSDGVAVNAANTSSPLFKGKQTTTTYKVSGLSNLKHYFWRVDEVDAAGAVTKGNLWSFSPRHLAFPGAEGYGRFARGGRCGKVVHVTNLNDSGTGSLRAAIENDTGPRTIVFDVGGVIKLASRMVLNSPQVTVAGQTAPGKGVTIRTAPFGMSGGVDEIIRHLRVRLGAGTTFDGMGMTASDHSIIDHASISWTIDEAFSSRNAKNITLQRTLISECLNVAGHQNYPAGTEHGYAGSIGGDIGSFHHNLLAHCEGRNWSMAGGLDGDGNFAGRLDIFSTVFYNWGGRTNDGGAHEVNFVNNYYKPGASSRVFTALNLTYDNFPGTQKYYMSGVVMPGYFDESNQAKGRTLASANAPSYSPYVSAPFFPSYATIQTAAESYKDVLSDVGMSAPVFDDHDARVVKETLNGTYTYKGSVSGKPGLPDNEADVGGYESYPTTTREASWDSDGDGLPNFWETAIGTSNSSASGNFADSNGDKDANGYTNLEEYLEWMSKPHYFTTNGKAQSIDLKKLFTGYTSSPTYSSSAATLGTVSISSSTASYTPTACGFGSVNFAVKDSANSTKTRQVVFFTSGC
ncbi:MAG: hypothetical protein QM784_01375 [Polyangiaceae bacterium]